MADKPIGSCGSQGKNTVQVSGNRLCDKPAGSKYPSVRKQFDAERNDTLRLGQTMLCVPAEGMDAPLELSITPLDSADLPAMPSGMVNVTGRGSGYRFLPHGEHFRRAAKVVLPFDSLRIPKGYTAKDVRTYYFDEGSRKWVALPKDTIREDEQLASAYTTHFTDMINGIIQVPESPESQGFTPTFMQNVKAADPSAGMVSMQAPEADATGSAKLSYPFRLPEGRMGMQPSLSLNYSSEASSGWVGYGWSLPVPTVDVDTRWGVPTFDASVETESYLLMGAQFTEQAHRMSGVPRSADKRFHLRKENAFSEIVRKGDAPGNYGWTVVRQDGRTDLYEGIAKDGKGNVVQWGVVRQTDVHGNFVAYKYDLEGNTPYISEINYTGHGEEAGAYTLKFVREQGRQDATMQARLGVMQKDAAVMKRMDVYYKEELIRSYVFSYKTGRFLKMMLQSVSETDASGAILDTHTFDYYDDLEGGGLFGDAVSVPSVKIFDDDSFFKTVKNGFSSNLSMISGASSSGWSVGGGVNLSVGYSAASVYGGASYSYSSNESVSEIVMTDIDGDGLPDKVYRRGGSLYYQPNMFGKGGTLGFGEERKIVGADRFTRMKSTSNTVGVDVGAGYWLASVGCSYSHIWDSNDTYVYMQDFNGDGLVDIADNGRVLYNRIVDGVPTFAATSEGTPNPIQGTDVGLLGGSFVYTEEVIEAKRKALEAESPLHDVVRVWRAPFDGTVTYEAPITVNPMSADGVGYAVQYNKKELVRGVLPASGNIPLGGKLQVKAGDFLYFRVQSVYSGTEDRVDWSPVIKYDEITGQGARQMEVDETGVDIRTYSASADFVQGEESVSVIAGPGTVSIGGGYQKSTLSGDVLLRIVRNNFRGDSAVCQSSLLPAAGEAHGVLPYTETLMAGDTVSFSFEMETKGQVDWRQVSWSPVVTLTKPDGSKIQSFYSPQRTMYNKIIVLAKSDLMPELGKRDVEYLDDSVFVSGHTSFSLSDDEVAPTKMELEIREKGGAPLPVVKSDGKLKAKVADLEGKQVYASLSVNAEIKKVSELNLNLNRTIVVRDTTITVSSDENGMEVRDTTVEVSYRDTVVAQIGASVRSVFNSSDLGLLYRGWGQFAYNGDGDYRAAAIDTDVLKTDKDKYEGIDPDNMESVPSIKEERFFAMVYDEENRRYIAAVKNAYLDAAGQCPSRLGNPEIKVDVPNYPSGGAGTAAPVLSSGTETNSWNLNGGAGAGKFGAGLGYSRSTSSSVTEMGALDLNGDRYPDWTERNGGSLYAQYTNRYGNIGEQRTQHNLSMPRQEANSSSFGGNVSLSSGSQTPGGSGNVKAVSDQKEAFALASAKKANSANAINSLSISASGSFGPSNSWSDREWCDMNGDGLPDMVYKGGDVRFNLGYGFSGEYGFGHSDVYKSESYSVGAGLAFSVTFCGSANAGNGVNYTNNESTGLADLADVNGDGLPDMHYERSGTQYVRFNTGTSFGEEMPWNAPHTNNSHSTSMGLHTNSAYKIPIPILPFSLTPFVNGSTTSGVSRTESGMMDVNGDGYPDVVTSDRDNELVVYLNRTGRTNLLRSVTLPMGGTVSMDYGRTPNTYDMPYGKYVLSEVTVAGGDAANGATSQKCTFGYEDGNHDRYERTFYGFGKVTTRQLDTENGDKVYRTVVRRFGNTDFYDEGLLLGETVTDAQGAKLNEVAYAYKKTEVAGGSYFPALEKADRVLYVDGVGMESSEKYAYDAIGNVTAYRSTAGDEVAVAVSYHDNAKNRRVPKMVRVEGGASRVRRTEVDGLGNVTRITLENGDAPSVFDLEYDAYGNLSRMVRPSNHKGERMSYDYTYDSELHSLVTRVTDAFGYVSQTEYDYRWALPTLTRDVNGNEMRYTYDAFGRPVSQLAPYEADSALSYTVKFEYDTKNRMARTLQYAPEGEIETYAYVDRLMRPVRGKKTALVQGRGKGFVEDGVPVFDAFGRQTRQYLPAFEGEQPAGFGETRYDAQDRVVASVLPDGSTSKMEYAVEAQDGRKVLRV
ncbi:MAG TPA: toxin TcdB middle/N-terminal domain-containing protein, partial [Clostridia bacterium]|nr:toxin TcdB middle/N-terminal domain-containing protein [Clostridia bacterium]